MTTTDPILVYCDQPWAERLVARVLGRRAIAFHAMAAGMDEKRIARFPAAAHCQAQEDNVRFLAEIESSGLGALVEREARARGCDAERFRRLVRQRFLFGLGHRLLRVRQALSMAEFADRPVILATDIPTAVLRPYLRDTMAPLSIHALLSGGLRAISRTAKLGHLAARHIGRVLRFVRAPHRSLPEDDPTGSYVAWLSATPAEVSRHDMSAVSLTAFLTEGSVRSGLAPFDIVVQGAAPVAGAPFVHRPHHPAWRTAPSFAAKALLILDQLRALGNCLLRGGDWRFTEVLSPILLELPALKAWFRHDRPAAVLYTNHVIGGEPAAALVGGAHGVRTMMVLYSTNYRYHVPPARTATEPATVLFPEARHVAADMVAMWSEEMAALYRRAGYPAERLPVVGPVHFAHEGEVRPTSRFAVGRRTGPVRIGVFDVSTQEPARLFSFGFGQTMYFRDLADRFFADLASACREVFGDDFVLVRKLKRALATGLHMPDVQLDSLLGADKRRDLDPDANLWRVLEDVDLVICMPFTSVALMADQIGVPSAFFDPLSLSERSEASGRIPHLLGKSELIAWMRAPHVPKSTRRKDGAAAQVMRLALGGRHVGPATAREAAE